MVDSQSITPEKHPASPPIPNATLPDSKPIIDQLASNTEHQDALSQRSKTLQQLIRRILPKHCIRERDRIQQVVEMTADGECWKDIEHKTSFKWVDVSVLNRNPAFQTLWHSARNTGEDRRKEIRLSEAHRRAVEGWDEPVFYKGDECGTIKRFSDKLHELLLKADDPGRFSDKAEVKHIGSGAEAGGITVNFIGVEFGKQPPPKVYDVPSTAQKVDLPPCQHKDTLPIDALQGNVEGQSVTKPLPKQVKRIKGQ